MLVNFAADRGEAMDLSAAQPEKAKELQALWDAWNTNNRPPRWVDARWAGEEARAQNKGKAKDKNKNEQAPPRF